MKFTTSILLIILSIFTISSQSQTTKPANFNDSTQINSIFDKMEMQGVDTKQNLLYGYFFHDRDKMKLEKLKDELVKQSYSFIEIVKIETGEYGLHVEKLEQHSRKSLFLKGISLKQLADKFSVESYEGFDIGNPDPTKPLISDESFLRFMKTKNSNELFALGINLYDLEINDKAELVFRECISQNIKTDTSYYKLGNSLIEQNKSAEGIEQLENAIKINPNYLNALYNLGAICYVTGKFLMSIEYYQRADKLKPNDDSIIYGIAASQFAVQQFDKSSENCSKALQLNPRNENAKTLLGMLRGKAK